MGLGSGTSADDGITAEAGTTADTGTTADAGSRADEGVPADDNHPRHRARRQKVNCTSPHSTSLSLLSLTDICYQRTPRSKHTKRSALVSQAEAGPSRLRDTSTASNVMVCYSSSHISMSLSEQPLTLPGFLERFVRKHVGVSAYFRTNGPSLTPTRRTHAS